MEATVAATPTPGGDPDAIRYAAMVKEFGDATPEPEAKPDEPAPAPEAAKVEEKKPDPVPYDELDKRYKNLQGALGEARGETRTLKEQMAQVAEDNKRMKEFLRAIAEKKEPDPNEDPYLAPVQRQIGSLAEQQKQIAAQQAEQQRAWEAQQRQQQIAAQVAATEQEFARVTPDYYDAVNYLRQTKIAEYEAIYPDDNAQAQALAQRQGFQNAAAFRSSLLNNDVMGLSSHAMQIGTSPAALAYQLAKKFGYRGPQQAAPMQAVTAAPQISAPAPAINRMDTIRQGQAAAGSLSTGASGAPAASGFPTIAEIAEMYLTDPDKAEQLTAKMKRAGLLT